MSAQEERDGEGTDEVGKRKKIKIQERKLEEKKADLQRLSAATERAESELREQQAREAEEELQFSRIATGIAGILDRAGGPGSSSIVTNPIQQLEKLKRPKGPFGNERRRQKAAEANICNEGNPTVMLELTTSSSSAVLGTLGNKCPPTYPICGLVLHTMGHQHSSGLRETSVSTSSLVFPVPCILLVVSTS